MIPFLSLSEHLEKIPYLLSLFLPVIIFFLFGLWLARRKYKKDYKRLKIAIKKNDRLAADITNALAPGADMYQSLVGCIESRTEHLTTAIKQTEEDLFTEQCRTRDLQNQLENQSPPAEPTPAPDPDNDAKIQTLIDTNSNLEREIIAFTSSHTELQKELHTLREQNSAQENQITTLTSQLSATENQSPDPAEQEQLKAELQSAKQLIEEQQSSITELEAQLQHSQQAPPQDLETELTSLREQNLSYQNKLTESENSATRQHQTITELQAELEKLRQSLSAPVQTSLPLSPDDETHIDDTLGLLYTNRPGHIDDLKRIKGVGKVLENKLHDIGIYRFKQIASWSPQQVRAFDERLSFKNRIERDRWLDQAAQFHREQYGENI